MYLPDGGQVVVAPDAVLLHLRVQSILVLLTQIRQVEVSYLRACLGRYQVVQHGAWPAKDVYFPCYIYIAYITHSNTNINMFGVLLSAHLRVQSILVLLTQIRQVEVSHLRACLRCYQVVLEDLGLTDKYRQ